MKLKTSCFNKTIYKKNITHYWPLWVIHLLFWVALLPLSLYGRFQQNFSGRGLSEAEIAAKKAAIVLELTDLAISPAAVFLFAVIMAMGVFSYLYTARAANMMHSLPVTRKELFITNYLSGITFLAVPQIIAFICAVLVCALNQVTSLQYLLIWLLCVFGLSLFFYSFCVFVAMFTGQLLALPVFALILNFLFVGAKWLIICVTSSISYGITQDYEAGKFEFLSPLKYLSSHVGLKIDYSGNLPVYQEITGTKIMLAYVLAALVFTILAYLVYKKRRLESAGDLISIPRIRPIFRWGFACFFATVFTALFTEAFGLGNPVRQFVVALINCVIWGIIGFFIAEMFLKKGFRVFTKKRIAECGVFAAFCMVALIMIECNLFGQETKQPREDQVQTAYINYYYPVGGSDRKSVEEILALHKQIIQSKKDFENRSVSEYSPSIEIRYKLKDGRRMTRSYLLPDVDEYRDDPDSVISRINKLSIQKEAYLKNAFGINYEDVTMQSGSLELYNESNDYRLVNFDTGTAEKIYEAVLKDLEAGNLQKSLMNSYSQTEGYLEQMYYNSLNLDYYCKDGVIDNYQAYWDETRSRRYYVSSSTSSSTNISFGKECTNILKALKDAGLLSSDKELITIQEKEEMDKTDPEAEQAR